MIEWLDCKGTVDIERINFIEKTIGHKFPMSFIDTIKTCDAGTPIKSDFAYFDENVKRKRQSGIGAFLFLNESDDCDFLETFLNPPEFFPSGLIAFADTGGGDFICFDYRNDTNSIDPPIVFWSHEADIGKDVSFLAANFNEFLSILEEPEALP